MTWVNTLAEFAQANLSGSRELDALYARGVSDSQILDYRLGYLDRTLPPLKGADAFLKWSYQGGKLEDCFVLPLTNSLGQVKGFQFRRVPREASGYTDYFASKDEPVFFGLSQAMPHLWKGEPVCFVEGAFDLFPMQRVFPATVATLTSKVSGGLANLMRRVTDQVIMGYDDDGPGKHGTHIFVKEYRQEFHKILTPAYPTVFLPTGKKAKDPSEFWEAMGDQAFGVYIKSAFDIH